MESYLNLWNFGQTPLARQSSIFSLTFDEFQNTMGGPGKDFGSMNMGELLKKIWTAEETPTMVSSSGAAGGTACRGNLQRQGSATLHPTLSKKTVDEVWRELLKESSGSKDGSGSGGSHLQQRRPTLGEMTLEEFLVRAGVVREDTPSIARPNDCGFYGELLRPINNTGLTFSFQQSAQNNNLVANQSTSLPVNVTGIRSSQQLQRQQRPQPQLLFPKQPIVALVQGSVIQGGMVGMTDFGTGTTMVAAGSPVSQLSSNGIAKSSMDTSSLSPSPFMFNEGVQGNKCGATLEKATERRRRRIIKNRESAARSRARKQLIKGVLWVVEIYPSQ